jgi:hypothetical protein
VMIHVFSPVIGEVPTFRGWMASIHQP